MDAKETDVHAHDRGLAFDLATLLERQAGHGPDGVMEARAGGAAAGRGLSRRGALRYLAGGGLAVLAGSALVGCADSPLPPTLPGGDEPTAGCTRIPEETAGPFPGDGSNGPNVLTRSGVVRSDIRSSFGSASGVAEGIPLTVTLDILDVSKNCAPLAGAAVYLWQCDREGGYSLYSDAVRNENYLRGVQAADASGKVTFTTIFPGAYTGRWPHIHFEVYPSLASATSSRNKIATSQLALPEDVCDAVYATPGYEKSVPIFSRLSLNTDMVFRDSHASQLARMGGDISSGLTARLSVPV